ncbi:MAG: SlyX family protein [Pseudomonadales bacterium]
MSDARIEELEIRVSFQEDLLQKLDDALAHQQREVLELKSVLRQMTHQIETLEAAFPDEESAGAIEKPPHY